MKKSIIEFRNVTLLRKGRRALDRVTFKIGEGENVAILGPNGSGKSSLIQLLTRELYPSFGHGAHALRIMGKDRWDLFELRTHLGIVTAELQAAFARPVTGLDAVLSGFFGSVGVWSNNRVTPRMKKRARAALAKLEVPHLAARSLQEMSAGEARRILIARALVHGPDALVLDEPTHSLDLRAVRDFLATLRNLARSGTSLILVTHSLDDIIPEISRVILLRKGKVFKDGPKEKVLTDRTLSALYGMQVLPKSRRDFGNT